MSTLREIGGLFVALFRGMWAGRARYVIIAVASGAIGGALVEGLRKPRTVTVTEYKDRVQTVEHTVTVEKPVVQWRDRVVTRTVYRDGKVESTTTSETKSGSQSGGKETRTDEKTDETKSGETKVTVAPEGRWAVRVLAGLDSRGSVTAGAAGEYRLVGPLTVGAWVLVPVAGTPGAVAVGLSAGLRF